VLAGGALVVTRTGGGGGVPLVAASVTDTSAVQAIVDASVPSIQDYWAGQFPDVFDGRAYEPLEADRVIAGRPGVQFPACGPSGVLPYDAVEGNAFYCYVSDYIAYDDPGLFTQLRDRFGWASVTAVMAHEWGHLVQQRSRLRRESIPPVYIEVQADCYTGSYLATQQLSDDQLDAAAYTILLVADPPGNDPNEPGVHGAAYDRIRAFQDGYRNGAGACARYVDNPPDVTARPEDADDGLVEVADDIALRQAILVADQIYGAINPDYVDLDIEAYGDNLCAPTQAGVAAWCGDQNKLSRDPAASAELLELEADDFVAAVAALGDRARALPGGEATPQGACLYGAIAATLYQGIGSEYGTLTYSISGVDGALRTAMLARDGRPGSAFATTDAFVAGFRGGWQACR
jgi:predicted metalloprotease